MNKIKVGIAGTGYHVGMSNAHLNAYLKNEKAELVGLYDILPGRAEKWAKEKNVDGVVICDTYDELLNMVDALSICTPNYSHIDLAKQAFQRGKHVLCEKPLALDYKQALDGVRYAKASCRVNMVGFSYRYIPAIKYTKKLIDDGMIGEVYLYREQMGGNRIANPHVQLEWRMQKDMSGYGALADFGSHCIDMALFLLEEVAGKIEEVSGYSNTFIKERQYEYRPGMGPVTNDDVTIFNARMTNGALLQFANSRIGMSRHSIEIYGSGGMILFYDNPLELEVQFKEKNAGYTSKREVLKVPDEFINPYHGVDEEIDRFLTAILTNSYVQPDFERGAEIQKIIDAIGISVEEHRAVQLEEFK